MEQSVQRDMELDTEIRKILDPRVSESFVVPFRYDTNARLELPRQCQQIVPAAGIRDRSCIRRRHLAETSRYARELEDQTVADSRGRYA